MHAVGNQQNSGIAYRPFLMDSPIIIFILDLFFVVVVGVCFFLGGGGVHALSFFLVMNDWI